MVGQLTHLHTQTFHLALEVARKAEVCFRRELGLQTSSYVGATHWNGARKGLLAAEKFLVDLDRLEVAYVENNRREHEITKPISLRRLDPAAIVQLRATGACSFKLPEALFDLDFPQHYFRRIKGITVDIACLSGTRGSIFGTLTMHKSQVRTNTSVGGSYGDAGNYAYERWSEEIALSGGEEASGLFTFDFRDPRYLPCEHRGVISEWTLSLAGASSTTSEQRPQFDWDAITDVALTVRYTARCGDSAFASTARAAVTAGLESFRSFLEAEDQPIQLAISLKRDAPDAWKLLKQIDTSTSTAVVSVPFDVDRLPYVLRSLGIPSVSTARAVLMFGPAGNNTGIGVELSVDSGANTTGLIVENASDPMARAQVLGPRSFSSQLSPGTDQVLEITLAPEVTPPGSLSGIVDTNNRVVSSKLDDIVVLLDLDFPT